MARSKVDSNKTDITPPGPTKMTVEQAKATGTLAETGIVGEIPLVNPAPVLTLKAFKPDLGPTTFQRYKVLVGGMMVIRGCAVHIKPGMTVSRQCDDVDAMVKLGFKLEEIPQK